VVLYILVTQIRSVISVNVAIMNTAHQLLYDADTKKQYCMSLACRKTYLVKAPSFLATPPSLLYPASYRAFHENFSRNFSRPLLSLRHNSVTPPIKCSSYMLPRKGGRCKALNAD